MDYRCYIVGADGHFNSFEVINKHDDNEALRLAEKLVNGHAAEVWQLDRKIGVLHPTDSSPSD